MLDLPTLTLVLTETLEHELGRLAVQECLRKVNFGDVLICTDKPELFEPLECKPRFVEVPNWPTKIGWSKYHWHGVPPHIHTAYSLGIQWDSWIWDVSMWREEFLHYDCIGAPWWYQDGKNVGNLGFGLRSTRLLRHVCKHPAKYPVINAADDDLFCRKYRPMLEDAGFVWAPERVARDFAFECVRPAPDSRHFGFHSCQNFPVVLDHEGLMERVRLMLQSPYIKNVAGWRGLAQSNQDIIQQAQESEANVGHAEAS